MPQISMSLSADSIEKAIQQLKDYAKKIEVNTADVAKEVAKKLEQNVSKGFNGAPYDYKMPGRKMEAELGVPSVPDVDVETLEESKNTIVRAHGPQAVFVEFGAGVYFNPTGAPHPARGEVNAIGTYGHGLGKLTYWRFELDGQTYVTHGTPASMPMYLGTQEIAEQVPKIAKEVFEKSG